MIKTIYHNPEWRNVLRLTYNYDDFSYGYDEDAGLIAPVMLVKNKIMNKKILLSLPFSDEAGPILLKNNKNLINEYFQYIDDIVNREKLSYVEIKGINKEFIDFARPFGYKEVGVSCGYWLLFVAS